MVLDVFHPAVRRWFEDRLGTPTPAQARSWPLIIRGESVLVAAPTGSGKTLCAFLSALNDLLVGEVQLEARTSVLYVSPLRALASDIQKNLQEPLAEIRQRHPGLPEVSVLVRTGDTRQSERQRMLKRVPHILVTTPESLYILLTSDGGRRMLASVGTVIVDEIHALAKDKRGAHLALSLERLEALVAAGGHPRLQRIGLSATQKPIEGIASFLVGSQRTCAIVDEGHRRELDLAIEVPPSPLSAVCSHEVWDEIYERMATLVGEHRTTLVFVNTRKMAERVAARLGDKLDKAVVGCHHGSLAPERRQAAEQKLKDGALKVLVATASLELGIDIGDVDLVCQVGATRSIAVLLQRVGRAGHGVGRLPKGRLFPLTRDELLEATALVQSVKEGTLDVTPQPTAPLDILAQQVVAACVAETWDEQALFELCTRAYPYRSLERDDFDTVVALHRGHRWSLLHRDGIAGRLRGTKRARLTAITSGGAIPDNADYRVLLEPEGTLVGTINEDFAIESSAGDIFQLGTSSWQILRVESGVVRVSDAKGAPPTLPFWLGEAPSRTEELSKKISEMRLVALGEDGLLRLGFSADSAEQAQGYVSEGAAALGGVPTQSCLYLERFFDESGGMQLVLHAPFGGRINRALGLALRKRFCRSFGFELQAAATEEAILLSLGPQHSFPLEEVFDYLKPATARQVLIQALLASPMFKTRWRWNVSRALLVERTRSGKRTPAPLLRMRADDLLAQAFPDIMACGENLAPGDLEIPMDHPIVRQTVEDCLHEAMDVDGFLAVVKGLWEGSIERRWVDTTEPSVFAESVLAAQPYAFLDDAPLEERRTQAVLTRRVRRVPSADDLGALDPDAIARVREEAWPTPADAEELHEALLWMGFLTHQEALAFQPWVDELRAAGRLVFEGDRVYAQEASRDPKEALRGRLEALGPIFSDDPLLFELEREGGVLRGNFEGKPGWCNRRLLARIHRYTLERLRREIAPVSAAEFLRFLTCFQHVHEEYRLEGARGVAEVLSQLAGFEIPAAAWEASVLPSRVRGYKRSYLDELTLSGEFAWARLWGSAVVSPRSTPISIVPRQDLQWWLSMRSEVDTSLLGAPARKIYDELGRRGAAFAQLLQRNVGLLPTEFETGLAELVTRGLVTCDSFDGMRGFLTPPSRRRKALPRAGRWSLLSDQEVVRELGVEAVAWQLLKRTGVVFRRTLARERQPYSWREILRALREMEARGDVRGGRFVNGFDGEQYALPEAVTLLRAVRRRGETSSVFVSAADPLNLRGVLTPDDRVSPLTRGEVKVI